MRAVHFYILLFFVSGELAIAESSYGQIDNSQPSFSYSVPMQRLQLKLTTDYIYFCLKGKLDLDSTAIMVSEAEHLPHSLIYDEDYIDGPDNTVKDLLKKGSYYLFKTGSGKDDLDKALPLLLSAKQEADKSGKIYWQNAALASLGKYYLQSGDPEKSKLHFTQAVDIARKAKDPVILARALANRGTNAGYNDPQKEKDLNESLQLFQQQQDKVREIEMLTRIYEIYFVQQKFDTVIKQLRHVTELEKQIGYRHIHYNHSVLGWLQDYSGNWSEVFSENKAAIAVMETTRDFAFSSFFYGMMANIYVRFEDYQKAMELLNKSIELEPRNKAKRLWYPLFSITSLNIAKHGLKEQAFKLISTVTADYPPVTMTEKTLVAQALGYIYQETSRPDSAKKYYGIMLPLLDSLEKDPAAKIDVFNAYLDLASYSIKNNQVDLSRKYYEKAKIFSDPNQIFHVGHLHWMKYKLDSAAGNYLLALKEYRAAFEFNDSMYNEIKAKQFSQLRIEYEIETKDKNIEILVQKDKAQQATLRQSNLVKKFTLAGILVMLLVTALVYIQYHNKKKRNKEINEKNLMLEQLVKDKEWLVKEIHHRVKNNFHIVASLLEIQSSYLKNKAALSAIKESQHRIHSMSIIHQKLYQSETLSTIHMPEYIYELVEYLRESYAIRQSIRFELNIENIELNHASAITLGLILNEAITNSIKYAFANTGEGKISISLRHISDAKILLSISDNGRGLPADFKDHIGASMGMELLQGLTDDIGGSFSIETDEGTHIQIIFEDLTKRNADIAFKS